MSIANLAHVRVACRLRGVSGDDLVNVYDVENNTGSAVGYTDAIDALADAFDSIYGEFNVMIHLDTVYVDLSFWDVENAAPMGIVPWPTMTVGGSNDQVLPSQVAGFIFFRTHKARCIGKKFMPSPTETYNDLNGRPNNTYIAGMVNVGFNLVDDTGILSLTGWDFVIRSSTDSLFYRPYQAVSANIWSTMRRRRVGRGS